MKSTTELIQIHADDNVAVATEPLACGSALRINELNLVLLDDIPTAHKVALADLSEGAQITKYGETIGYATAPIQKGQHVHSHNMKTGLSGLLEYTWSGASGDWPSSDESAYFQGYPRPEGRAGVRNEIWIVPTVGCVNNTAVRLAEAARARYGSQVDGFLPILHNNGCSQLGDDFAITQRLLSGLVHHPNAGGVLVISLGCENNNLDLFQPALGTINPDRIKFLTTQNVDDELEVGMELIDQLVAYAGTFKRQPVPVSELTLGFKCGSSDAFSGITANPLCGWISDHVVSLGGSTILTEVPEMFGAETILMARAANKAVFQKIVSLINDFKQYFIRHDQPVYENPAPGNIKRGITTLEEKSLGCIRKGGHAPVMGVLGFGDYPAISGLHLLNGPGNDPMSVTNMIASGAQIVLFTTGGGNPFGGPVPTIKISSNTALQELKKNWIDFDAGTILSGQTFAAAEADLFQLILRVASGATTRNEDNGYREISIFRDGVIL